jgi:hypothetical protein
MNRTLMLVPLLALAGAALAHHSAVAYGLRRDGKIEGTVEEYLWANPHSIAGFR